LVDIVSVVVPLLFAIVGLAILTWLVIVAMDFVRSSQRMQRIMGVVLEPAPGKPDVDNSALPVRVVVEGVVPIVFWLLLLLPMIIFPVVLILFPILGIPWSYLLPPVP
jgi:hypothetical protein